MIEGIHLLESGEGDVLTHLFALNVVPAVDARLLFNTGPREELYPSNKPLEQANHEGGLPVSQFSSGICTGPEPDKKPPDKPPYWDNCNDNL